MSEFSLDALAVNAHGEAAMAWATRSSPAVSPRYRTSIHLALRDHSGHVHIRVVWSSARHRADAIAVALDPRGEATVAWIARARRTGGVIRAAYGTAGGRSATARTVGHGMSDLRAAVAGDGEVLLTWADSKITYAIRSRGRAFHSPRTVNRPRAFAGLPRSGPIGAIGAYDARGRAYLAGQCDPAVAIARPRTRRFTRTAILAPGPVVGMSFSVTGAGDGLASWAGGRCTSDEMVPDTPGPVAARTLRDGSFGPAITLDASAEAYRTNAVATSGGGGIVTWGSPSNVFSVRLGPVAPLGPAAPVSDGRIVLAVDGGGDQVLSASPGGVLDFLPADVSVRPAKGAPDQLAPVAGGGQLAVSAPHGRAVAMTAQIAADARALTVWRP